MAKDKEEKGLVPVGDMSNLPAEVKEMYAEDSKENLENVNDSFHRLSTKGSRFKINGELAGREGIEFQAVILREMPVNVFYKGAYDPNNVEMPDCFSVGGLNPDLSVKDPCSTSCIGCPNNNFNTGTDAEGNPSGGKACNNTRRLILTVPGIELPVMLSIPPSSLGAFNDYLKLLATKKIPLAALVTKITFDQDSEFPRPIFEMGSLLDTETYKEMRVLRNSDEIEKVLNSFSTGEKTDSEPKSGDAEVTDDKM